MASYRLYSIGPQDRLQLLGSFEGDSDALALAEARRLRAEGQAAELWKGGRLVGRFSKLGVFTPA